MRVLGVDPGTQITGYGMIETKGNKIICVSSGTIRTLPKRNPLHIRLALIFETLSKIIEQHRPRVVVVESVFHARNAMSALKLGHARGVVIMCAAHFGLELVEYTPRAIKKGITGSGASDKNQVQKMVGMLLQGEPDKSLDATDALAAAIFHTYHNPLLLSQSSTVRSPQI